MPPAVKRRVLFICIGNACRSPMAEAVARQLASDVIEPSSAGLSPLGRLAKATEQTLIDNGYSIEGLCSKPLRCDAMENIDLIINMSGQSFDGFFGNGNAMDDSRHSPNVEDWDVEDPYGGNPAIYRRILVELESRVLLLASRIRTGQRAVNT